MTTRQAPLIFFLFVLLAFSVSMGVICRPPQLPERIFPTSNPSPYTLLDILGTPDKPDPTPERHLVYVVKAPTPKPVPTYDSTIIPDLDEDSDCEECERWICHYDRGDRQGYHYSVGFRTSAAHLNQHPNDYYDDRWGDSFAISCDFLSPARAGVTHDDDEDCDE